MFRRAREFATSLSAARTAAERQPGTRFIARYDARSHLPRAHPRRLGRILVGLGLFAIGMLNVFIPGPGGSIFIFGSALALSSESRTLARLLDRGEVRFQRQIRVVLDRPIIATATISIIVLALVFGAGVAIDAATRSTTTRVTSADAAELVGADTSTTATAATIGLRPTPGTYAYAGTGTDSFDFGPGTRRTFPDEANVVVMLGDEECGWSADVVFIEEHVEHRTYCTTQRGVEDTGFARSTTFLGRDQTSTYECSDGAWRSAAANGVGSTWSYTCTEERGGVVKYVARRLPDTSVEIDGAATTTTHIVLRGRQRGRHVGDERSEFWLLPDGLPARFSSRRSLTVSTPLGSMTSTESFDYTLRSLKPHT